ncbi:MAG TPA: COQ9 family protein [Acetobacteraceae bacterium]|nr:COQ9 family protein [Acetobacteraceae bacterium]
MIAPPERSPERDAALDAMLPNVPFDGWTYRALRAGLASIGVRREEAELLFPGGASDMIEAFCDLADRRMAQTAAEQLGDTKLPERVRAVIALRLSQNRPCKEAVRRAVAVLALPRHARLAAACTARTVDAIWHEAGDRSADFSWYTKRAILTAVYTATLLFWLRDSSEDNAATLGFLDRRLAGIARTHRLRRRAEAMLHSFTPAAARERSARSPG